LALDTLSRKNENNKLLVSSLQKEIEVKTSEIESRRAEIESLQKTISEFQEDHQRPDQWNLCEDILEQPIVAHIHEVIKKGHRPSDKELEEIRKLAESYYPGFVPSLKELYPRISSENIIFCILIKLRFIPSELAIIFGSSDISSDTAVV
jgi:Fic family protein